MKKKFIITALILAFFSIKEANSQWINSVTVTPQNPTVNDTVRILVNSNFPSGDCDQSTQFVQVNGNIIDAYTIHCLGFATFICNDTDTFLINPLPAGNYTFRIQLDMGGSPAPCTPGIIPMQTDSINFTVSPLTGVGEQISSDDISILPNPGSDYFSLNSDTEAIFPATVEIFSTEGKRVGVSQIQNSSDKIDIRRYAAGQYLIRLTTVQKRMVQLPLIISR